MASFSPTAEGFRAAVRRPSLTLGEIAWRWTFGATAAVIFLFGLFEYLDTLPVTNGELLFLRTRHPYLVAQAIAHIFRGSMSRVVAAALVASLLLGLLWIVAGSLGRIATVRALIEYFHSGPSTEAASEHRFRTPLRSLFRLNFLRAAVALAAVFGLVGAAILADFVSPDASPQPWLAFLLFVALAGMIVWAWLALNWLLSLAGMFAVRDGNDAPGAISSAVSFCRERAGAVFAVSSWTGLAHFLAFVGASIVATMALGMAPVVPWRLMLLGTVVLVMIYSALADWLYMARLAGYVCIAETPMAVLKPPPAPMPAPVQTAPAAAPPAATPEAPLETALETTIDRDEVILSDVPNPPDSSDLP
jgi:hypothetical protein